jgi:hypothetical protein
MDKLLKSYGGIDGIIETIKGLKGTGETIYKNAFLSAVIWYLEDYKKIKEENKRLKKKISDDSWGDSLTIGDRQEMGG